MKYAAFLHIARRLNRQLGTTPLLFGSLGLERRLDRDLNADDIDVLLPERFIHEDWPALITLMAEDGYVLVDASEHAFQKDALHVAFASLESLAPFAGIDPASIPALEEDGARYLLLTLPDYLKVYRASAQDGYRKTVRHKKDQAKIDLILEALNGEKGE